MKKFFVLSFFCASVFSVQADTPQWVELTAYDKIKKSNDTRLVNLESGRCFTAFNGKYRGTKNNKVWLGDCYDGYRGENGEKKYNINWNYVLRGKRSKGHDTSENDYHPPYWDDASFLILGNIFEAYIFDASYQVIGIGDTSFTRIAKQGSINHDAAYTHDRVYHYEVDINASNNIKLAYNTFHELRNDYGCMAGQKINLTFYHKDKTGDGMPLTDIGDYWTEDASGNLIKNNGQNGTLKTGTPVILFDDCLIYFDNTNQWQFGDIALPHNNLVGGQLIPASNYGSCITYHESSQRFVMRPCAHGNDPIPEQLFIVDGAFIRLKNITGFSLGGQDSNGVCLQGIEGIKSEIEIEIDHEIEPGKCTTYTNDMRSFNREFFTAEGSVSSFFTIHNKANAKCLTILEEDKVKMSDCDPWYHQRKSQQWRWKNPQ